jgi:hypothetical protein
MLVPDSSSQPPPEIDDRTSTPGAATSGFSRSEIVVGPTLEKSAWIRRAPLVSTAPTVIASSAFPGELTEPAPNSL